MKKMIKKALLFPCFSVFFASTAFAGAGFYAGIDGVYHRLETDASVTVLGNTVYSEQSENYGDVGVRGGYKHRIKDYFYIAPEIFVTTLDLKLDEPVYGTTLKAGFEMDRFSIYGLGGYSRIEAVDKGTPHYGVGAEIAVTDYVSVNAEWNSFAEIDGSETSGNVNITRDDKLDAFKLGITLYFHE